MHIQEFLNAQNSSTDEILNYFGNPVMFLSISSNTYTLPDANENHADYGAKFWIELSWHQMEIDYPFDFATNAFGRTFTEALQRCIWIFICEAQTYKDSNAEKIAKHLGIYEELLKIDLKDMR